VRLVALTAAVLGVLAPEAQAADTPSSPGQGVVIADGHVDMGPRFVDGRWTVQVRDDRADPVVWRSLEDVVLQATSKAAVAVPADPKFGFLGRSGQRVFVLPQVQQAGILWPGWNTQDPEVASKVNREVTWTLHGVEGPGRFTLFLNADFGKPSVVFDSRKAFPQRTGVDVDTHVHGNWAFDAEGTYLLDVEMSAVLLDGSQVTDRRWLRIHAGDTNPAQAFAVQPKQPKQHEEQPEPQQPPAEETRRSWLPIGAGVGGLLVLVTAAAWVRRRTRRPR
jgi:putative ABC transporter-associated repeat protein